MFNQREPAIDSSYLASINSFLKTLELTSEMTTGIAKLASPIVADLANKVITNLQENNILKSLVIDTQDQTYTLIPDESTPGAYKWEETNVSESSFSEKNNALQSHSLFSKLIKNVPQTEENLEQANPPGTQITATFENNGLEKSELIYKENSAGECVVNKVRDTLSFEQISEAINKFSLALNLRTKHQENNEQSDQEHLGTLDDVKNAVIAQDTTFRNTLDNSEPQITTNEASSKLPQQQVSIEINHDTNIYVKKNLGKKNGKNQQDFNKEDIEIAKNAIALLIKYGTHNNTNSVYYSDKFTIKDMEGNISIHRRKDELQGINNPLMQFSLDKNYEPIITSVALGFGEGERGCFQFKREELPDLKTVTVRQIGQFLNHLAPLGTLETFEKNPDAEYIDEVIDKNINNEAPKTTQVETNSPLLTSQVVVEASQAKTKPIELPNLPKKSNQEEAVLYVKESIPPQLQNNAAKVSNSVEVQNQLYKFEVLTTEETTKLIPNLDKKKLQENSLEEENVPVTPLQSPNSLIASSSTNQVQQPVRQVSVSSAKSKIGLIPPFLLKNTKKLNQENEDIAITATVMLAKYGTLEPDGTRIYRSDAFVIRQDGDNLSVHRRNDEKLEFKKPLMTFSLDANKQPKNIKVSPEIMLVERQEFLIVAENVKSKQKFPNLDKDNIRDVGNYLGSLAPAGTTVALQTFKQSSLLSGLGMLLKQSEQDKVVLGDFTVVRSMDQENKRTSLQVFKTDGILGTQEIVRFDRVVDNANNVSLAVAKMNISNYDINAINFLVQNAKSLSKEEINNTFNVVNKTSSKALPSDKIKTVQVENNHELLPPEKNLGDIRLPVHDYLEKNYQNAATLTAAQSIEDKAFVKEMTDLMIANDCKLTIAEQGVVYSMVSNCSSKDKIDPLPWLVIQKDLMQLRSQEIVNQIVNKPAPLIESVSHKPKESTQTKNAAKSRVKLGIDR